MSGRIFINYRRSDSQHAALALAESLRWSFADGEVFLDRSSLLGGDLWPTRLEQAVQAAKVVVVVIGERWLLATDVHGRRRIDHPDDWVRREIETALRLKKKLIPVTLDGSAMPVEAALDKVLAPLSSAQSLPVRADSWDSDLHALIQRVANLSGAPARNVVPGESSYPNGVPIPRPERRQRLKPLTAVLLEKHTAELAAWRVETNHHPWAIGGSAEEISRVYEFKSFMNAARFIHDAAADIDTWDPPHHPRWENQWKVVKVRFTTWDVGCRLTKLDIKAAREMDRLYTNRDPVRAG